MLTVSYFSAGVSSAVATKLAIEQIDRIMYTHIDDHEEDALRFVGDCEEWFGKPVEIWQSPYKDVDTACRANSFIRSPQAGAVCTRVLKRNVRKQFEYENEGNLRIVWGLDCTETERIERILQNMPNHEHLFPLAERKITKEHAHQILAASGIKRPRMYDLGYNNGNCKGCVKGGMGYWNHIRIDFPEVFESRSKLERDLGFPILSNKYGYLDELDPERGRHSPPIVDDCGIMCELMAL
jgi:hypothetical protein